MGYYIVLSDGHVSQSSIVLHTANGGKTWMPVPDIETYGLEVEPAFSLSSGHIKCIFTLTKIYSMSPELQQESYWP
jgi:hypothetical protein